MRGVGQLPADASVLFDGLRTDSISRCPYAMFCCNTLCRSDGYRSAGSIRLNNCSRLLRGRLYSFRWNSYRSNGATADLDKISAKLLHAGFLHLMISVAKSISVSTRIQFGISSRSSRIISPGCIRQAPQIVNGHSIRMAFRKPNLPEVLPGQQVSYELGFVRAERIPRHLFSRLSVKVVRWRVTYPGDVACASKSGSYMRNLSNSPVSLLNFKILLTF